MSKDIRVTWKATGHESTIPAHRFDADRHDEAEKPAVDRLGKRLPALPRTDKAGKSKPRKTAPPAAVADGDQGQKAEPSKEND